MSCDGSVTHWLDELQAGDSAAAQRLWERYFHRLIGLAREKLDKVPRRAFDEEDIALSAFASFCRGAELGRFPQLNDRDNLWHLLVTITERKARHKLRDEARQKRGGGAALKYQGGSGIGAGMAAIIDGEPSPAFAAEVADECRRLLDKLADAELQKIAIWKMEGHSNDEITQMLDCAPRSLGRKLQLIRTIWTDEVSP